MLRKGWLEGRQIFRLDQPAIGLSLLPIEQTIIVVCMNCSLDCFTKKGKRLWSVELSAPAVCMVPVLLQHIGQTLVCVALRGGLVQLYMNKVVVDQFNVSGECDSQLRIFKLYCNCRANSRHFHPQKLYRL